MTWACRIVIRLLCVLAIAAPVTADTFGDVATSLRHRGVYFDADRFPDSVLLDFCNDIQVLITTMGRTKQAETTFALGSQYAYPLPADFHQVWAGILNADPEAEPGPANRPYFLDYVRPERFGSVAFTTTARPTTLTVWGDSVLFDSGSEDELDSVRFFYFALPVSLVADSSTIDLPGGYIPLLKDALAYMCVDRIVFPGRSDRDRTLALVNMLSTAILGRPDDKHVP